MLYWYLPTPTGLGLTCTLHNMLIKMKACFMAVYLCGKGFYSQ